MRKTKTVVIDADGRDKGKMFKITEMPAAQAERWAFRAFQALARTGAEVPEHVAGSGMAGVAMVGLKALGAIPYAEATELMDEMFSCVQIVRDKSHPEVAYAIIDAADDIEEVATRAILRTEVFELHTGFSLAGLRQKLTQTPATPSTASPTTKTSPRRSPSLSRAR